MARPREFDIDDVLDAATAAFWERGYEATSVADLMEITGLQKGSLYKAFGDKRTLFLTVLERYLEGNFQIVRGELDGLEPNGALRHWLRSILGMCHEQETCRGCLGLNTAVELGPHDEEVQKILQVHFKRMSGLLAGIVEAGQEAGEFRTDRSASHLAEYIMVVGGGLLCMSKFSPPRARTERLIEFVLDELKS